MPIRDHRLDDADAIADILAEGWATAYSGFMPEPLLTPRVNNSYRRNEVGDWLTNEFDPTTEKLLVSDDEGVNGFVNVVLEDKAGLGAVAHIDLLYVSPAKLRQGIGRKLMLAAAEWLETRVDGPVVLSAYAENLFRLFYDRIGGVEVLRRTIDFDGFELQSVYYRWETIGALRSGITRS